MIDARILELETCLAELAEAVHDRISALDQELVEVKHELDVETLRALAAEEGLSILRSCPECDSYA